MSSPSESGTIRAAILDDEPLARLRVRQLLEEVEGVEVVGEFGDAGLATDRLPALDVDLLFVDIEMPELDGFEVVHRLGLDVIPAVVFVTAHADRALQAFEAHALDYLVKPFTAARFSDAVTRARGVITGRGAGASGEERGRPPAAAEGSPLRRIPIRTDGRIRFLPVTELDWVEADGNYLSLHAGGQVHRIRRTLSALEEALPGDRFIRVHRSALVNLDRVVELQPWSHGDYLLVMADGAHVVASRTHSPALRSLLGVE